MPTSTAGSLPPTAKPAHAGACWPPAQYRWGLRALRLFILSHLLGLLVLPLWLQPGLDAGVPLLERARYIAAHPWLWRAGWNVWQLCALSDVLVTLWLAWWAWGQSRRVRCWGGAALLCNIAAVIPEQWAEWRLVVACPAMAQQALSNDAALASFAEAERWSVIMTGVCGNSGYVLMTIAWFMALSSAQRRGRRHFAAVTTFASLLFVLSSVAVVIGLRTGQNYTWPVMFSSGPAFVALIPWAMLAAHHLSLSSGRPVAEDDHLHAVNWSPHGIARWLAPIAASHGLRDLFRPMPTLVMGSDISDIVYLNWLVPAAAAQQWLPAPLHVHDLQGMTVLSILSYRHGSFGPVRLGPLRRLFPSPAQSNWRLYLAHPDTEPRAERDAIYFIHTAFDNAPLATAARLLADGLPAQVPTTMLHQRRGRQLETRITTHPEQPAQLHVIVEEDVLVEEDVIVEESGDPDHAISLPAAWAAHFRDTEEALRYLVEQNRAVAVDGARGEVFESAIAIPIDIGTIRPATVKHVEAPWLDGLIGNAAPFAFVVPAVSFRALGERSIQALPAMPHSLNGHSRRPFSFSRPKQVRARKRKRSPLNGYCRSSFLLLEGACQAPSPTEATLQRVPQPNDALRLRLRLFSSSRTTLPGRSPLLGRLPAATSKATMLSNITADVPYVQSAGRHGVKRSVGRLFGRCRSAS